MGFFYFVTSMFSDEYFMNEALKEAQKALENDEVPVGAIIVIDNKIIARSYNMVEKLNDTTAHAEMIVLTSASNYLGSKYLKECILYVTIEPCPMCAGALYWAQISKIVYGAKDPKRGYSIFSDNILHPTTKVVGGILEDKCSQIIRDFFRNKRNV